MSGYFYAISVVCFAWACLNAALAMDQYAREVAHKGHRHDCEAKP